MIKRRSLFAGLAAAAAALVSRDGQAKPLRVANTLRVDGIWSDPGPVNSELQAGWQELRRSSLMLQRDAASFEGLQWRAENADAIVRVSDAGELRVYRVEDEIRATITSPNGRVKTYEKPQDVTLHLPSDEYDLLGIHPRGVDRLRPTAMVPGDHWHVVNGFGKGPPSVHIIVPKGAATVTRTGKRVMIDLA
jgi:hypothetical protein